MNDNELEARGHAERLTLLIDEEKIKNPRQLALSIEMDPSQLTKVMRAESTLPYAQAKKISTKYGYSIEWLMDGSGDKKVRTNHPRENSEEIDYKEKYIKNIEQQNNFLQKTVEANLNEVLLNQDILLVQTKVSMIRSAERYVKDDPAKIKAEIVRINKLLLEYVAEDVKKDMILIDDK